MAHIFKEGDGRMTSIRLRYSHIPFKKLVSRLFYVLHTSACCIYLRLLGLSLLSLLELTSDSFQSRETVTGAPSYWVSGIDRHLPVRMCRFTADTGTIITKPTLIQQVNLTLLTHLIFNLRKPLHYAVQQSNLSPPSPTFVTLKSLNHSVDRY